MNEQNIVKQKLVTCIVCPNGCEVTVKELNDGEIVAEGYECKRGLKYSLDEFKDPKRILATTVRIRDARIPLVPVRTREGVPKNMLNDILDVLARIEVKAPIICGDVVLENILDTGVDVIATRSLGIDECNKIACTL
mgnify:CR=1 FL=1